MKHLLRDNNRFNPIRTGAFLVATKDKIGVAIRRHGTSGYTAWQLHQKPIIVACPPLPQRVLQEEFEERLDNLVRINNVTSVGDVTGCIEHILSVTPPTEAEDMRAFAATASFLADRVMTLGHLLFRDLVSQSCAPEIETCIRQMAGYAIQGYVRGYYASPHRLTKAGLDDRYSHEAYRAVANAGRNFDVQHDLILSITNLILDEILSDRISLLAKRIIVAGFQHLDPKVQSVDLDGYYCDRAKYSPSDHDVPFVGKQSFFVDAGDCYEVGRFACGLNTDTQMHSAEVTKELLGQVDPFKYSRLGEFYNSDRLAPGATDVATLAIKMPWFNGMGLVGTPIHKLLENADPAQMIAAMKSLLNVADIHDSMLGITEKASSEVLVLSPEGILDHRQVHPDPYAEPAGAEPATSAA